MSLDTPAFLDDGPWCHFNRPVDSADKGYGWVRMDLTRHRSAKKVVVPDRLTQLFGRDQDLTRTNGNGISRVFPGNLWPA